MFGQHAESLAWLFFFPLPVQESSFNWVWGKVSATNLGKTSSTPSVLGIVCCWQIPADFLRWVTTRLLDSDDQRHLSERSWGMGIIAVCKVPGSWFHDHGLWNTPHLTGFHPLYAPFETNSRFTADGWLENFILFFWVWIPCLFWGGQSTALLCICWKWFVSSVMVNHHWITI